jgi:3-oxoacyl-[acyl-carrier protein] reductase
LDVQVSNAGITDRMPFLDMPLERFERILRTNLTGTILCGQAAARLMMKTSRGRIVNLSSVSGQAGGTGRAAYDASKAAIINLTQTMAVELAVHDILVNAIAPGPTQVERTAHGAAQRNAFLSRMALQRYASAAEIAAAALFLLCRFQLRHRSRAQCRRRVFGSRRALRTRRRGSLKVRPIRYRTLSDS